ncbi:hypothetical protein CUT44_19805 [Streptomyces carminius]|uniref:Uncharacterized protein n=1 Tax=Streptomyces carminius TaxID=2665496 RepID=A0A2M8LVQ7_9ACTN|nr:hypothetical protein [Streptomyces carminius]PJE96044.1 hypothetical protein CUT44_19805 [Streptomyces carminius]
MVVTLIIVCEVGFWVLLAVGLALRYLARRPRLGAAVLLCEPLLELVLLAATAIDLRGGAEGNWTHGLAAVYVGFTVAYGHYMIKWADGHFAHRFAGGPPPVRPPKYGRARAVHEWRMCARSVLGALVAMALLQGAVRYVGDAGRSESLVAWQQKMLFVIGISLVIAIGYTLWPKRPPGGGGTGGGAAARPAGSAEPERAGR